MSEFKVDFIELMILAEVCVPPTPIARSVFWEKLCDVHYHLMSIDERKRAFEWITGDKTIKQLNMENEDCRLFYSRFNPDNQYEVTCSFEGQTKVVDCFKFNDKFHTNRNITVNEQYIINSILKLTDKNK